MSALRFLVDWPWVVIDVECSICPRQGRYRLARLAERYGAAIALDRLLEAVAVDCTLMKPGEKPRHYEARCGIRYVVPAGAPELAEAPARAGKPKPRPEIKPGKKRAGYDGPPPTLAMLRQQGIRALSVTCHSLWKGATCHRTTTLLLDQLAALDDVAFPALRRRLRLVCSQCGGRTMHIVPLWPDPREEHANRLGVDLTPRLPAVAAPGRPGAVGASPDDGSGEAA